MKGNVIAAMVSAGILTAGLFCAHTMNAQAQETESPGQTGAETTAAETEGSAGTEENLGTGQEAVYLGIENYGAPETNKENRDHFRYRFSIDGQEQVFTIGSGEQNEDGEYDYPIQNMLKEGYSYLLTTDADTVISVQEIPQEDPGFVPAVSGTPGELTLASFLKTALMPAGTTLYIYGGGWDWQDAGSSVQARILSTPSKWPRSLSSPRSFAHRPFPSMIMDTC